jgi:hypothetical protein
MHLPAMRAMGRKVNIAVRLAMRLIEMFPRVNLPKR